VVSNLDVSVKTHAVLTAAINSVAAERADETNAYYAAHIEYTDGLLALAARDLVRSIDALPPSERPIGWGSE
jgi:hypothetical protein